MREKMQKLEKFIEEREQEKKRIEQVMTDPEFYKNGDRVKEVTSRYTLVERELVEAYHRWNDLTKELELAEGEHAAGRHT